MNNYSKKVDELNAHAPYTKDSFKKMKFENVSNEVLKSIESLNEDEKFVFGLNEKVLYNNTTERWIGIQVLLPV